MIQGIYKITNVKNGKIYIGSSKNITYRWEQHICELLNETHHNKKIQNDFIKQGKNINDFKFEILEIDYDVTREDLYDIEGKYIIENESYRDDIGYNIVINNKKDSIMYGDLIIEDYNNKNFDYIYNYKNNIDKNDIELLKNNLDIKPLTYIHGFNSSKYSDLRRNERFLSKSWFMKNPNDFKMVKNMMYSFFANYNKSSCERLWTTYYMYKDKLKGNGYTRKFINLDSEYNPKQIDCAIFLANIYINCFSNIEISINKENQNTYALSFLLKWIINNIDIHNKCKLFIPSIRMYNLLYDFLNEN